MALTDLLLILIIVLLIFIYIKLRPVLKFLEPTRDNNSNEKDSLFWQATQITKSHNRVSASLLQRRLAIGYARASRLLDQLEEEKYVASATGSKPREVLPHD